MSYRMLSIEELASELGWTYARVYRLVRTGQIPYSKVGGRICFLKSTIDAWVKSLEQPVKVRDTSAAMKPAITHEEECRRLGIPVNHMFG